MMNKYTFLLFFLVSSFLSAQSLDEQLSAIDEQILVLKTTQEKLVTQAEDLKLQMIQRDLVAAGLPETNYISHSAMALAYDEQHEQAKWVAHIIRPEIIHGSVFRSNDFREDPLIESGTAVEEDYFLKELKSDGEYAYDGFGYDRGHLAPSADFKWSAKALSESYFYSNMSPQKAALNRHGWAELEGALRAYIFDHPETQLYIVTGPVLHDDLPVIERSINKVSIPEQYYKVALDLNTGQAIGFVFPNEAIEYSLGHYAKSVDEIETLTGLDFFNLIANEEQIEASFDLVHWLPESANGDVDPIYPPDLPRNHFNTVQAKQHMGTGRTITVCGKIVGSRYSRSGNLWFNLDKQFPNQICSVFIKKKDLVNFSMDPKAFFDGQTISVRGKVDDFSGVPTINISKEEDLGIFSL